MLKVTQKRGREWMDQNNERSEPSTAAFRKIHFLDSPSSKRLKRFDSNRNIPSFSNNNNNNNNITNNNNENVCFSENFSNSGSFSTFSALSTPSSSRPHYNLPPSPFPLPNHFESLDNLISFIPKKLSKTENTPHSMNNSMSNNNRQNPSIFSNSSSSSTLTMAGQLNHTNNSNNNNNNNNNNISSSNTLTPGVNLNEPLLTIAEVRAIVEKALHLESSRLKALYDNILLERLDEQYNMFSKFNEDNINRQMKETECSYLS